MRIESGRREEEPIDLYEIYRRVVTFFNDKRLEAIESGNLERLGEEQISDLRILIEKSRYTHPPILHRLKPEEIEALENYINQSESMEGFTVDPNILASALRKLRETLEERLKGAKTKY
jgi:hypothetical protein